MAKATAKVIRDPQTLSGVQRAAVLVMYLDPKVARTLLEELSTEEIQEIGLAMAEVDHIDPAVIEQVVAEFVRDLFEVSMVPRTGQDFALKVLPGLVDEGRRAGVAGALRRRLSTGFADFISSRPPRAVATILKDEHPQVQAVAMLLMGSDNAAAAFGFMDEHERLELATRMSRIKNVAGEFADAVEDSIRDALENRSADRWAVEGLGQAARALARLDPEQQLITLELIAEEDPDLADVLRRRMVSFDDLAALDDKAMRTLLKNCAREVLAVALRGADPAIVDGILGNMSSRAAEDLKDEIELLGPTSKAKVEEAREELVQIAVRLRDEGAIEFGMAGDEMV